MNMLIFLEKIGIILPPAQRNLNINSNSIDWKEIIDSCVVSEDK